MKNNTTFANREVCNMIIVDYNTGKPFMEPFDYANTTSQEITGDTTFAYGGQGHPKRVAFYGEKGGTFKVETQIQTMNLYKLITGANESTTAKFMGREELKPTSETTFTLTAKPTNGENITIYKKDEDGNTPINCSITTATDSNAITVTVAEGETALSTDETYVVYYIKELTGVKALNIKSTTFPKNVKIYADTLMKGEDDTIYNYKLVVYKAAPQVNFSLSQANTGDPATITITFDLMADKENNVLDLILDEEGSTTA